MLNHLDYEVCIQEFLKGRLEENRFLEIDD